MFDISWSEFLIVGAVALVFLGPEELPGLLRTIGRYTGMIKRQAAEFRSQFDQAMRDAELDKMKRDVERISEDAAARVRDAERGLARSPQNHTENSIAAPREDALLQPVTQSHNDLNNSDARGAHGIPVAKRPVPSEPAAAPAATHEPKTGA